MSDKRFEVIYKQGKLEHFRIIRDNETGVLYLQNHVGHGVSLTVLVDQDGKPLVDQNFKK